MPAAHSVCRLKMARQTAKAIVPVRVANLDIGATAERAKGVQTHRSKTGIRSQWPLTNNRRESAVAGRFLRKGAGVPHAWQTRFAGSLSPFRCQAPQTGHCSVARSACISDKTEGSEHGGETQRDKIHRHAEHEARANVVSQIHHATPFRGSM